MDASFGSSDTVFCLSTKNAGIAVVAAFAAPAVNAAKPNAADFPMSKLLGFVFWVWY